MRFLALIFSLLFAVAAHGAVSVVPSGTGGTNGGSGSTEVVASAYFNVGDGAISTNAGASTTYSLFRNFDTNKLAVAAIGDSFFDGANRIFAQLTNLPGWNSLAFYTNSSLQGTSLDTNALTPILALAPRYTGGGTNLILFISFGANPEFGTSPTLANIATSIANRSNLYKMATNAGIIVFDTITTTRTNETAARVIQKKLEGDYIRRAVLTGQIHYVADFDKAFSPFIYDYIYSDDGLHPTTVGSQMAARIIDATVRRGIRNSSGYDTTLPWRSVTQTNASTNLITIHENSFTGTRLVTIDDQLGDITTIGKVTGNIQAPLIIQVYGPGTTVTNGTGLFSMSMPQGFIATGVKASVVTPTVSGTITVDVLEEGSSILSTLPVIDQGEYSSATGTQGVVSDPTITVNNRISVNVSGTYSGAAGLVVAILGYYVQ